MEARSPAPTTKCSYRIRSPVKHSIRKNLPSGVCLLTKDPQSTYKPLVGSVPEIAKVIGVTKLGTKFKGFEAKRALCASYDFFLADDSIIPMLPKKLGKTFFLKKKQPVAVDLSGKSEERWKREINKALHNYTYMFRNFGSCL